jgi:hypothetical protein
VRASTAPRSPRCGPRTSTALSARRGWGGASPRSTGACARSTSGPWRAAATTRWGRLTEVFMVFRDFRIPGGESHEALRRRVHGFVDELPPGRHLLFVHGGVIRVLTQDLGLDRFVSTGSLVVVDWAGRRLLSLHERNPLCWGPECRGTGRFPQCELGRWCVAAAVGTAGTCRGTSPGARRLVADASAQPRWTLQVGCCSRSRRVASIGKRRRKSRDEVGSPPQVSGPSLVAARSLPAGRPAATAEALLLASSPDGRPPPAEVAVVAEVSWLACKEVTCSARRGSTIVALTWQRGSGRRGSAAGDPRSHAGHQDWAPGRAAPTFAVAPGRSARRWALRRPAGGSRFRLRGSRPALTVDLRATTVGGGALCT